jgi:DNA modification methylase
VFSYSPDNPKSASGSELLGSGKRKNQGAGWARPSNVIEVAAESGQGDHSAPFPRLLVEFFLKAFSDAGEIVFERTAIVTAHVLGRSGRGCEISPLYCDVAILRWQKFSGGSAKLEGDGRGFEQIAVTKMRCRCCSKDFTPRSQRHRVACGDATARTDVEKLMASGAADLVFCDPPYNVGYQGYTKEKLEILGDRMTPAQFQQFLLVTFTNYRAIVKPGASIYVFHSSSSQREFQNAIEAAGFAVRCQIVWAKNTFAWGFGRYKFQHEPLFYGHVAGQKDAWYGDKSQSTLWQEKKPTANRIHPTAKPVELVERALLNSSKAGDIVADLFGGSGSTLIACERRGRTARLMELDPRYADCIVRRWQEYTGKRGVLAGDGRTFDEIRSERLTAAT